MAFLKLGSWEPQGSANGCQGFRESKTCDGQVLLALLCLYGRIKIRVATFATNLSVTDIKQSIVASVQKLPDSVVKSASRARHRQSRCVRRNDQVIDQFKVSR